jgi:hypothetical protein
METKTERTVLSLDQSHHQNRRSELGKAMGLDVGAPNEMVELDGVTQSARDDVGLLLDTKLYAKSSCSTCYGRGIVTVSKPVGTLAARKLIERGHDRYIHESKPGKYSERVARMCECARSRYQKLKDKFIDKLVSENLAKTADDPRHEDVHGKVARTVELL